jgi:hypothetical protein
MCVCARAPTWTRAEFFTAFAGPFISAALGAMFLSVIFIAQSQGAARDRDAQPTVQPAALLSSIDHHHLDPRWDPPNMAQASADGSAPCVAGFDRVGDANDRGIPSRQIGPVGMELNLGSLPQQLRALIAAIRSPALRPRTNPFGMCPACSLVCACVHMYFNAIGNLTR